MVSGGESRSSGRWADADHRRGNERVRSAADHNQPMVLGAHLQHIRLRGQRPGAGVRAANAGFYGISDEPDNPLWRNEHADGRGDEYSIRAQLVFRNISGDNEPAHFGCRSRSLDQLYEQRADQLHAAATAAASVQFLGPVHKPGGNDQWGYVYHYGNQEAVDGNVDHTKQHQL